MKKKYTIVSILLFLIIFGAVTYLTYISLYVNKLDRVFGVSIKRGVTETFKQNSTINNNNTIVITNTLPNNLVSEKRRNNLVNNFSLYNIPILLNHGIKDKSLPSHHIMFSIIKNAFNLFIEKTNYDYALICDDDFYPIDNFLEELNKTVDLLPSGWRTLHLCPGYLWGRDFKDMNKIGKLNPHKNVDDMKYHISGRFFSNCGGKTYYDKQIWLGGPIAVLVKRDNVNSFISDFISQYNKSLSDKCLSNVSCHNNDVIMTAILTNDDFICREPMLGYEKEEGGSTFS